MAKRSNSPGSKRKSRSFSLYLLKPDAELLRDPNANGMSVFEARVAASLQDQGKVLAVEPQALKGEVAMYLVPAVPREPWWREFFGVSESSPQQSQSGLVFIGVEDRVFVVSLGYGYHQLSPESYEHDFGLLVTLNCVDRQKVRNTDTVEASTARRRRTQQPADTDFTLFDLISDESILKSLSGKVKDEYQDLFSGVTGASSLRLSSSVSAAGLRPLCARLLQLYGLEDFKETFPEMQHISPVRDPTVVQSLDAELERSVQRGSGSLRLSIPAIVDYHDALFVRFEGAGGASGVLESVFLLNYFDYVGDRELDRSRLTVADLKKHRIRLVTEDGVPRQGFSIYRSMLFEAPSTEDNFTHYLVEGQWYRVDNDYLREMDEFLDRYFHDLNFPSCIQHREDEYNQDLARSQSKGVCLDKTDIRPRGQTQVEPCDVISLHDGKARLIHVKISTVSSQLSHLFNQATNSVDLLNSEAMSNDKLRQLVIDRADPGVNVDALVEAIDRQDFSVVIAIITHKPDGAKSTNLPLFSRISLRRNIKALEARRIPVTVGFVQDEYDRTSAPK